jgi:hemoglobin
LEAAHREFHISPEELDEAAAELGRTLDTVGVPEREKGTRFWRFAGT